MPFYPSFAIPLAIFALLLASRKILMGDAREQGAKPESTRLAT